MLHRLTPPLRRAAAAVALLAAATLPAALAGPASAAPATAPPLTVASGGHAHGAGDIFITPTDNTTAADGEYADGAEILSRSGRELWFHAAPAGDVDADLRPQSLDGRPVLTFWEGTNFGSLSNGTDYIYNDHYREIAAVHAGPGLTTDGHEFLISPWGTAFVVSYDTATANLSSIGGPPDQTVIDGIVQEIDIHTGKVLWSWDSADHVPYSQSEQPLPATASDPWDWFHVNAIKLGPDGSLLIDARDTWTMYDVSPHAGGRILWQLGGKDSSLRERAARGQTLDEAGRIFAWQHDPEYLGHDEYTFFDNESAGTANTGAGASSELSYSRVVTVRIDPRSETATLVAADNQPEGGLASSQGNGQRLPGGGEFVGWGILNSISQFDRRGRLTFNAEFPSGVNTYRAYLLPWGGGATRAQRPARHHRR